MRKINTRSFVRATRWTPREINLQILLNLVREHEPISRAELARRMKIGRGMVTYLTAELIAQGALYEGDRVDSPRGRRPQMLYVRTHDRLAIAIDIRFSSTFVMLTDFSGNPIALESFDTIEDISVLVPELQRRVRRMLDTHAGSRHCEGVGLVVPGMVDAATGEVLNAPQLGWRNVDVRTPLQHALAMPVHVENAPIACALAQMWLGRPGSSVPTDFVYVTVSDGVGAGVVVNGQVVRGQTNSAGEFGHVPLTADGPVCLCGNHGCLEVYTSNLATVCRYLGRDFSPGTARDLLPSSGVTIAEVVARALAGEQRARDALDVTARHLGAGLAVIIKALSPTQIVVGGEITEAWAQLEPTIRSEVARRALTDLAAATPILPELSSAHPRLRGGTALVSAPVFAAPRFA
ncbi:MAG TPA: ROK family protein [Gemmatimonadaceae bacterium]|nr:ROK family protein [Gemmatimonadaceae bacterium]